jgi:hypothetical protein
MVDVSGASFGYPKANELRQFLYGFMYDLAIPNRGKSMVQCKHNLINPYQL